MCLAQHSQVYLNQWEMFLLATEQKQRTWSARSKVILGSIGPAPRSNTQTNQESGKINPVQNDTQYEGRASHATFGIGSWLGQRD